VDQGVLDARKKGSELSEFIEGIFTVMKNLKKIQRKM
jgi:hypothetical protein